MSETTFNREKLSAHHHLHTDTAVDGVHEDIEFVCVLSSGRDIIMATSTRTKTTDGAPNRFPKGQQKTNSREGFLPTTQGARILLPAVLRRSLVVCLHLHSQQSAKPRKHAV